MELLAPAGDAASLRAAILAGADAVYLGLTSFNARRGAQNFTLEEFCEAADFAHLRGVKVYVALNTIVLPHEFDQALECARQAYRAGADAFIVSDIGLISELARTLPQARLHISTQMNIHNRAGIRAAARFGAKRVTLARELSLQEIAALAQEAAQYHVEIETFVHGALCMCYSGQCYLSSAIGKRSANRGTCAQACRLPYELYNTAQNRPLHSPGSYLLSPRDLCAIDLLGELKSAGAVSLKIEGRMKSAEYVFAVTAAYRGVLDRMSAALCPDNPTHSSGPTDTEMRSLEQAFSRGFTSGYLKGNRGTDTMSYLRPNNRGLFIGRITALEHRSLLLKSDVELSVGDILEVWTGKGHSTLICTALSSRSDGSLRVGFAYAGNERNVPHRGDRIFRVKAAHDALSCDAHEPRLPVSGNVVLHLGEPARVSFRLTQDISDTTDSVCGEAQGDLVELARTKEISKEEVYAHIDRLGETSYRLTDLDISLDTGVGIGFSELHCLRREALSDLTSKLLSPHRAVTLPRVKKRAPIVSHDTQPCSVFAWVTNPACAKAALRAGAQALYVPILNAETDQALSAGHISEAAGRRAYPKGCTYALPTIRHDSVKGSLEDRWGFDIEKYVSTDATLYVDNVGDYLFCRDAGLRCEIGTHIPLTNMCACQKAAELGCARVWLSPELTLEQISALGQGGPVLPFGYIVMGNQEVMVCEHCLLMSQGPCDQHCLSCSRRKSLHYLKDRKGFEFPFVTDKLGRSHLYNSVSLDVCHVICELIACGVTAFMVDCTLMNTEEASQAVKRACRAVRVAIHDGAAIAKREGTTSAHLFRGVD